MTIKERWRLSSFIILLAVVLADQFSKFWLTAHYFDGPADFITWLGARGVQLPYKTVSFTSFFNLVMVWNPGVSFGMLQTNQVMVGYGLSIFAVLVSLGFLVWLWREPRATVAIPCALIAGGALGNVWDRVRFGAVADFFDVHIGRYHWPAFNIADSAITIGVVLLLIDQVFLAKQLSRKGMRHETV